MKIAIMQPTFMPWAGYFALINYVDKFVFLNDVQFNTRSWQQRNKIFANNKTRFLTVPILKKNLRYQKINEAKIDVNSKFKKKHINTILQNYSKSKYFNEYKFFFQNLYSKNYNSLSDMNIFFIKEICKKININCEFYESDNLNTDGAKSEKILNICKKLKVKEYVSVLGSKEYLENDKKIFDKNEIQIIYFNYMIEKYQTFYKNFYPKLSIVDILFNCGHNSKKIIIQGIKI